MNPQDDNGRRRKKGGNSLFTLERFAPRTASDKPARVFTRGDLSEDQGVAYDAIVGWLRDGGRRQHLSLGGLAGTGKTTLVAALAPELAKHGGVVYTAFTGRAAGVLASKLVSAGVQGGTFGTLHSLIYKPVIHSHGKPDENLDVSKGSEVEVKKDCEEGDACTAIGKPVAWRRKEDFDAGLVVLDEASMVGTNLWEDLQAYGVPILAVGDHGQLPPVGDSITNLMREPDIRLEKIHRQAAGNPIIELAHFVRAGGMVRDFKSPDNRVTFGKKYHELVAAWNDSELDPLATATLCYYNATRVGINRKVRRLKGLPDDAPPGEGDVVICLRNQKPIFNGMRGMVTASDPTRVQGGTMPMTVVFPDDGMRINATVNTHQFGREKTFDSPVSIPGAPRNWVEAGMLFDYGYALTCHKAQGSQWDEVALMGEGNFQSEDLRRRWVYTACTRAKERLHIVTG